MYGWLPSTATWPRRNTVSKGSLTKTAAHEEQKFATENVIGETVLSIKNLDRSTSGVDKVRSGWTREWRMVGTSRMRGHR